MMQTNNSTAKGVTWLKLIQISSSRNHDSLLELLANNLNSLPQEGMQITVEKEHISGRHLSTFYLERASSQSEDFLLQFCQFVSKELSEWLLEEWEPYLIERRLWLHFAYFSDKERSQIRDKALQIVQNEETTSKEFIMYRIGRKHNILEEIIEIVCSYRVINIDGFCRFRLKKYMKLLNDSVDLAVDEFMMEKEYNEFIRLLKYFLEIQESRRPIVHAYLHPGNHFHLSDEEGNLLSGELSEEFTNDLLDNDISYEDLLISALITVAPQNLVIHFVEGARGGEELNTIYAVFGESVFRCPGCEECTSSQTRQER